MLLKTTSIAILFVALFLFSCKTTKPSPTEEVIEPISTTKSIILVGTIQTKTFTNKIGKEIAGMEEFYFKTDKNSYFIKLVDSRITKAQATQLLEKEIEIEGELLNGLWDISGDDPAYAQSRTGEYLIIHSFTPIINH